MMLTDEGPGDGGADGDGGDAGPDRDFDRPDHDRPDHEGSDSSDHEASPLDASDRDRFSRGSGGDDTGSDLGDRGTGTFGSDFSGIEDPLGLRDDSSSGSDYHLLDGDPGDLLIEGLDIQSGERASDWFGLDMEAASAGLKSIADFSADFLAAIGDFVENYLDMRAANTKNADRFFHCQANCQASGRGPGGLLAAKGMSYSREVFDLGKNVVVKGMSYKDSLADCKGDMAANRTGWDAGSRGLRCNDACSGYRPRGL